VSVAPDYDEIDSSQPAARRLGPDLNGEPAQDLSEAIRSRRILVRDLR
jgi:hypothetical protein